jgi:predicted dehydrogenase
VTSGSEGRRLRAGVIGAGLAARELHLPCLREIPGVEVAAVCDADGARARALVERFGGAAHEDAARMLEREALDLVLVLTPPESHAGLALAALEAGCHVLIEKPFSYRLDEADRVVARAAERRRALSVIHNEVFTPGFAELRARLARGEIGELCSVQYTAARRNQRFVPERWYYESYGGRMGETLPHALCLLVELVPDLAVLHVDARTLGHQIAPPAFQDLPLGVDELRVSLARADGRATAHVWYGFNSDLPTHLLVAGTRGHLLAYPFGRVTHLSAWPTELRGDLPGLLRHAARRAGRKLGLAAERPTPPRETGHYRQLRDFVESVAAGRPPAVSAHAAREVVRLWSEIVGRFATPPP